MGRFGKDSSELEAKLRVRQRIARTLPPTALVFESCTGEGRMHDGAWHAFAGLTCDINDAKVSAATRLRPRWLCLQADAEDIIKSGALDTMPFAVVDLDFYGSPWAPCLEYLTRHRAWPEVTHLLLTDGFATRANIAGQDAALFPGLGRTAKTTPEMVWQAACSAMARAATAQGLGLVHRWTHKAKSMAYHYLTLERGQS